MTDHIQARFWPKVDKNGPLPTWAPFLGRCWVWTGSLSPAGYGRFYVPGVSPQYAHRLAYEWLVGPIPDGLVLDHLCRVPACCNPAHLEAVTTKENLLRGSSPMAENARRTSCPQGHPRTAEHVYVRPDTGTTMCRTCYLARSRARTAASR